MRLAVEHAGAERGLLILLRGAEPQIEAEVTTGHEMVAVTVGRSAVTPSDLPQSALHYVIRTRQRVLLDDASIANLYSEDEYLRQKHPKSVLCVPIVNQTKLVGVLYLENTLTPRVFTSDRVTVLELVASQAAISLENASLYSDLQRSEADLLEAQQLGRVHTTRSASTMRANERKPRKRTSSFSKREKMRRNPLSLRNRRSISLRFL